MMSTIFFLIYSELEFFYLLLISSVLFKKKNMIKNIQFLYMFIFTYNNCICFIISKTVEYKEILLLKLFI